MPIVAALPLTMREGIRVGIERGESDSEIGGRLGRHRCTINAEISRNGGRGGPVSWTPEDAESSLPLRWLRLGLPMS